MSFSTAITLSLAFKKFARKRTLSRRPFRKTTMKKEEPCDDSGTSLYSSEEKLDYIATNKSAVPQADELITANPTVVSEDPDGAAQQPSLQTETMTTTTTTTTTTTITTTTTAAADTAATAAAPVTKRDDETSVSLELVVRDFAYPESSPLHYGQPAPVIERKSSVVSLSSSEFTGRQARALYHFVPETEYEIGMEAGEVIWVQYRQSPGWLIADVKDETGLIPESYVEFI